MKRHKWIPGMRYKLERMDTLLYGAEKLHLATSAAVIRRHMRDLAHDIDVLTR